jgi:hypothetical protein
MFYRLKFRAMASLLKNNGNLAEHKKPFGANYTQNLA